MAGAIGKAEALKVWLKVAMLSFGGPAGQIAVMHRLLVEEKGWVSESRFLHALNFCMLLPGPEAQQLATYLGWLMHRTWGALVAGILFILPGFIAILILSILYAAYQQTPVVQALFYGLKPAVLAVVVHAVHKIGKKALKNHMMLLIAALAFVAIFFFDIPFPLIVLSAGLIGFFGNRFAPQKFQVIKGHGDEAPDAIDNDAIIKPSWGRAFRVLGLFLLLWFGPLLGLILLTKGSSIFLAQGLFFSKMAVVTFGGAYAVLAYVAQQAVEEYGWLRPHEMVDGLGMAETTPGPLIQVVQFVGFMGAYRYPGTLDPMVAGILASVLVTWVTFVPCFLWIFLGAPYIERLRQNQVLTAALSAITAAVVGVILNLSIWFSLHVLFGKVTERDSGASRLYVPDWASLDLVALSLAVLSIILMFRFHLGMIKVLFISLVLGMIYRLAL